MSGFRLICLLAYLNYYQCNAQDPVLPPTNLGLVNVYDGVAGKPGFVYQGYGQVYNTKHIYDPNGNNTGSQLKVNSLLFMHQLIYLSPLKVLNGNLGFTVLIPVVKISATDLSGPAPLVNPSVLGDIVWGTAIQWSDKKLFGKTFFHRMEIDLTIPTGAHNARYAINPSAHLWAVGAYHALTIMIDKSFTMSMRNQINYNSHLINSSAKPGAFYNGNYSVDLSLSKKLKIEAATYFLTQFTQDSFDGDYQYYQDVYQMPTTKQRVFGFGPGLAYFLRTGVLFEAKVFFETAAKNTTQGTRGVFRIAVPF